MNLFVKIIISVVIAAIAATLTTRFAGAGHSGLFLFIAFCAATVATTLLVSLPVRPTSTSTPKNSNASNKQGPVASADSSPRANSGTGKREDGLVKWFNVSKGFGFITKDDGEEIFVHFRSIQGGGGRRGLKDGQRVSFIVADSDKGPQAEDVEALD